jgi:hypothetical protein
MSDPELGAADGPAAPAPGPGARRPARRPVRGRWATIVVVAAVVVVVGVISASVSAPSAAPAPGAADGVPVPPAGSYSSSAFCPGGAGTAAATTVYLTNTTSRPVTGVMTSVGLAGSGGVPTTRRGVAVPARGTAHFSPASGLPAGNTAASFVFAGGGVVATQLMGGPGGWTTAPCASQTAPQWSFAGGSTSNGNTLALALFDPAAPVAVVDVSFLTATGLITPQAYQGLVVPSGQLVVENVGAYVQNAPAIATFVTTESGSVVSTEFQQWSGRAGSGISLRLGSPALSTVWRFAQTSSGAGANVVFELANPASVEASATVTFDLTSGTVMPRTVSVPPASVVSFSASGTPGLPQQAPYSVIVTSSAPIVVGRTVLAAAGSSAPVWGSSSGTVSLAGQWVVPGPGTTPAPGTTGASIRSLAVANPGRTAARVVVVSLDGSHTVARFVVPPRGLTVLGPKLVGGLTTYRIVSSEPVNVEEDSLPSGAPGVVSSTGFPLAG